MTTEASPRITARHARILDQIDTMAALAADPATLARHAPEVSAWTVGLQVEHALNVHRSVVDVLDKLAAGGGGPGSPSPAGRLFLLLGFIPRGRGKAPERVLPQGVDPGRLAADYAAERQRFAELDLAVLDNVTGTLPHPAFGALTPRRWLRFLQVHNHHHWKIIQDILQSSK